MSAIDLAAAIRRYKPDRHTSQVHARPKAGASEWWRNGPGPRAILLDTTVYIDRAAGRLDPGLCVAIDSGLLFHSTVALAELSVGVGNADPARPGWKRLRDHYTALFAAIPATRLLAPDTQTWADAGLVAGALARTQRYQPHQRKECLNDTLIALTGVRAGLAVLTANVADFDLIQQIAPDVRVLSC